MPARDFTHGRATLVRYATMRRLYKYWNSRLPRLNGGPVLQARCFWIMVRFRITYATFNALRSGDANPEMKDIVVDNSSPQSLKTPEWPSIAGGSWSGHARPGTWEGAWVNRGTSGKFQYHFFVVQRLNWHTTATPAFLEALRRTCKPNRP